MSSEVPLAQQACAEGLLCARPLLSEHVPAMCWVLGPQGWPLQGSQARISF